MDELESAAREKLSSKESFLPTMKDKGLKIIKLTDAASREKRPAMSWVSQQLHLYKKDVPV